MQGRGGKRCKAAIDHISRIQGQFETLKSYLVAEKPCDQVVQLAASVLKSCNSLKAKLAEGYLVEELLDSKELTKKQANHLEYLVKLIKI